MEEEDGWEEDPLPPNYWEDLGKAIDSLLRLPPEVEDADFDIDPFI